MINPFSLIRAWFIERLTGSTTGPLLELAMKDHHNYFCEADNSLPPFAIGEKVLPISACVKRRAEEAGEIYLTIADCFCSKSPQGKWIWWVRFEEISSSYFASDVQAA